MKFQTRNKQLGHTTILYSILNVLIVFKNDICVNCCANEPCSNICEWTAWMGYTSQCARTCGTTQIISRNRCLCCQNDWTDCNSRCGKDWSEYTDTHECGRECYNGGTFTGWFYGSCACATRYFGECCESKLPACDVSTVDIIFVLDSSVSQTEPQFRKQLEFVTNFIDEITIGPENVQVGVVTFSSTATVEIQPSENLDKAQLKDRVSQIAFRPGATYTHKGLEAALRLKRTTSRRPGMELVTYFIVLTDGMSTNRRETENWAATVKNNAIHVVAVGVGKEVSHKELQAIASPPDIYSSSYVFSVGSFDALYTLLETLAEATCPTCVKKYDSDIVFVVDDDGSRITQREFQIALQTATYIVENVNSLGEANGRRIGLISTTNPSKNIQWDNSMTKYELLSYLQRLTLTDTCSGEACAQNNDSFPEMIENIAINDFSATVGGRSDSRKFLLVLSSGRFGAQNITNIADRVSDVTILALGLGQDFDMDGLLSLVTEPSHVYVTSDSHDLSHLDVLIAMFSYVVCN